jgi:hypothetical protein
MMLNYQLFLCPFLFLFANQNIAKKMKKVCNNINCNKKREKMKVCSLCKVTKYCDIECQKQDWESHKEECERLTQMGDTKGFQKSVVDEIIKKGFFNRYNVVCKDFYNSTRKKGFVMIKWTKDFIDSKYFVPKDEKLPFIGITGITELMKKIYHEFDPSTHFIFFVEAKFENKKSGKDNLMIWCNLVGFE